MYSLLIAKKEYILFCIETVNTMLFSLLFRILCTLNKVDLGSFPKNCKHQEYKRMIILYAVAYLSLAYAWAKKTDIFILGTLTIMTVGKQTFLVARNGIKI